MDFENQLIFFFSISGAFNGLFLSIYFASTAQKKKFSNYFLAMLLLMLSIRIIKSVFFYFNPQLSNIFIQIGLSACILIGPFLFLYLKSYAEKRKPNWIVHVFPYLIGISILGLFFPYVEHRAIWSRGIVKGIYLQWFIYIILAFPYVKPTIKKFKDRQKVHNIDIWIISIYLGVLFIWAAHNIGAYTSYIVGALSYTFVIYLIALLFIFKINKKSTFFQNKEKYHNKEIDRETIIQIEKGMALINEKELFLNPNLTLTDVARELKVSKHNLSQYLNEKLDKSFSTYINELRIEKAKQLLQMKNNYTIDGLGYESGFNSKSTFYTVFKKITGKTPSQYRKENGF